MKKIILSLVFMFTAVFSFAAQYENPMLDMTVPSGLEDRQAYIEFEHKFFQSLYNYPSNDFFALLNWGADIKIGLRYMIWNGIEAKVAYISQHREKVAGLSYVLKTPDIGFNSQVDVQFINYFDYYGNVPAQQNLFYLLSLESVPFLDDRVTIAANAGYDGFNKHIGAGFGMSVETMKHLKLMADYYPVLNKVGDNNIGCYGFGIKIDTYGHQFIIRAGNSSEIGPRDLMLGTVNNSIYIGFEIMRLIDLSK